MKKASLAQQDAQPIVTSRSDSAFPDGAMAFAFAGFRLEPDGTLRRGESVVHLPPKELSALKLLLEHAGQIVSAEDLRQALWGDVHVTADSVPKCLSSLRARLEPEECIQTIYKQGYRFCVEVERQAAAGGSALARLALVPFATGYTVPEHLGQAIAEETGALLTRMAHPMVLVLARDSVFNLAQRGLSAQEIGEKLKANLVLTGTLRTLVGHFRLRAEMVRVEDGAQIWVEDVLVPHDRVGGVEWELARRLVERMSSRAGGDVAAQELPVPALAQMRMAESVDAGDGSETADPTREAYEIFQHAHFEWQTLQRHRMEGSLKRLYRAIELDPALAPARVDLVNLAVTQAFYGFLSPASAAEHVRRAVQPWMPESGSGSWSDLWTAGMQSLPEAVLPALGWMSLHMDHDLAAASDAFARSAHLPHDPWITRARAMFALSQHRFGEAVELLQAAIQKDPFSPWLHARLGWALHLAGEAAESVECIEKTIARFPEHAGTNLYGATILAYNGDGARGIKLAAELCRHLPYFDLATCVHAYALACGEKTTEARSIMERVEWMSRERFVLRSFSPAVYVALGDFDSAIEELRASAESRCPWFLQMLADPRLKPLAGRTEFQALLATTPQMQGSEALV